MTLTEKEDFTNSALGCGKTKWNIKLFKGRKSEDLN